MIEKKKVVIRRIPHFLSEEEIQKALLPFRTIIKSSQFLCYNTTIVDYRKKHNLPIYNRCYLYFGSQQDVLYFYEHFRPEFLVNRARPSLSVEFSPSQSLQKLSSEKEVDERAGTFHLDPIYQKFAIEYEKTDDSNINEAESQGEKTKGDNGKVAGNEYLEVEENGLLEIGLEREKELPPIIASCIREAEEMKLKEEKRIRRAEKRRRNRKNRNKRRRKLKSQRSSK